MSTAPVADDGTAGLTDIEKEFLNFDESGLKDEDVPKPQDPPAPAAAVDPAVPADSAPAVVAADPAAVAAPEAAPAVAAAPAAEPEAAPAPAADPVAQPSPFLVIQAPADAKEKLAKISEDKAALASEFDAGDITGSVFQQRLDALNKDERTIETAVNNAELTAQMEKNRAQMVWNAQCDAFMAKPEAVAYKDEKMFAAFNDTIKAISVMPRNRNLTGDQVLAKAHQMMQVEFGTAAAPAVTAAAAPAPAALPKPQPQLPPNIGSLPAADVTDTNGGQYAHLDRLASTDPIAYEDAVAKLSDSARDAYFKAG